MLGDAVVDCGNPTVIANGRGFMANGTTYQSVVTYQCLPDFQLIGDSIRTCLITGKWSGLEPKCTGAWIVHS
ncbi:hypothetical protein LAZ67_10000230 [Cordylochernes scorpioides]|uniref:Sushi domain-containing protein n=1 Tax=Cordylochernes scorpioides TaxID=51811 RepID=A0ABY6KUW0_9ARAC|nr:hypothetical protein LAZ67_10000230 [Cordylochernes scorpioides]